MKSRAVRTERGNAAFGQTRERQQAYDSKRALGKTASVRQQVWGRGGDRPDAGEKSGKNAALGRPAPGWEIGK